jgi:formylmethanofuran dehydrogenase subunit A
MALHVHGLVGIPRNLQVREVQIKSGWLICFTVASPNPGTDKFCKYPITVWVSEKDKEDFLKNLTPRAVFSIETGTWNMRESVDGKYNFPELKVNSRDFVKLVTPLWYQEKQDE